MDITEFSYSATSVGVYSEAAAQTFIFISTVLGLLFGLLNLYLVLKIDTSGTGENLLDDKRDKVNAMNLTADHIQKGANTFLMQEYVYIGVFVTFFFIIIFIIDNIKFYTAFAFVIGCLTSLISGYIGMYVATRTNVRVTYLAAAVSGEENSLKESFNAAFRGGCVMGFFLCSLALMILTLIIIIYKAIISPVTMEQFTELFDYVAGYGLGGSTVALFCRVGGGIYTKAADVGADLVGKNEFGLDEDSPDNPATIADNVGDNVGDIAGMGSDLFGSFAESTCAALVVSGSSKELILGANFYFPLMISAGGIIVCIITSFFATHIITVTSIPRIEKTLRWQLIISSLLLTPLIVFFSLFLLPSEFTFHTGELKYKSTNWGIMICGLIGLWCGMIIGYFTDYFTSTEHAPVQELANSCKSGAAINIIQGLALGYLSCIIPMVSLACKCF
jgi:H(+)-translocating pyrophosphatase